MPSRSRPNGTDVPTLCPWSTLYFVLGTGHLNNQPQSMPFGTQQGASCPYYAVYALIHFYVAQGRESVMRCGRTKSQNSGPLQWGRGLSTAEIWAIPRPSSATPRGFNGAAVFQPRKCCGYPSTVISNTQGLQWGRGLSTAEMRRLVPAQPTASCALQWGRGLSTAEMRRRWDRQAASEEASMGPRSFNRGNWSAQEAADAARAASMGPRSFNRGNSGGRREHDIQWLASMGPRSFNRGNFVLSAETHLPGRRLQWGRGLSTAEMALLANRCQRSD